jgi:hypothetical protein
MKIIKSKHAEGVYLLRSKTQYELASTFLRIQEHYESPFFSGKIFSLEQYMDWCAARTGSFTYYEDSSGFSVPSSALQPFYEGKVDPLLRPMRHFGSDSQTARGGDDVQPCPARRERRTGQLLRASGA